MTDRRIDSEQRLSIGLAGVARVHHGADRSQVVIALDISVDRAVTMCYPVQIQRIFLTRRSRISVFAAFRDAGVYLQSILYDQARRGGPRSCDQQAYRGSPPWKFISLLGPVLPSAACTTPTLRPIYSPIQQKGRGKRYPQTHSQPTCSLRASLRPPSASRPPVLRIRVEHHFQG